MMNYTVFPILLNLLPTICLQCEEITLINQLNNYFDFDHNIFLLDSSIDRNSYITTRSNFDTESGHKYVPQSVYNFKLDNDSITGLESLNEIKSKNPFLIIIPGCSTFETNIKLLSSVKSIQRLNVLHLKIGVFFSQTDSIDSIKKLFDWFWKEQILNVFSAFYLISNDESKSLLNVFTFNPFGVFGLKNVTISESLENYFPSQSSNFQQYPIRIPMIFGAPVDYDWKLWSTVIDFMNASVAQIELDESVDIAQLFDNDTVDLLPHIFIIEKYGNIYPIKMDTLIIVVPQASPFSDFSSYLRRMTSKSLFAYTFITIALVTLLLIVSGYIETKMISLFQHVADVLNLLMNDNTSIKYQKLFRVEVCLIVPLTFAGFIVVNGILSIFQSYVMLPVIQPQINTIDDLYKSPYPILVGDISWASTVIHLLELESKHDEWRWSDKVVIADLLEINQQIFLFNTSISFLTMTTEAKNIVEIQKRLGIRGYHIPTETYLVQSMLSYAVNGNFPFIQRFNDIIHSIRDAGFDHKWQDDHNELVVRNLLRRNLYRKAKRSNDSENDGLPLPTVIFYGWMASVLVFLGEIVWEKYKLSEIVVIAFYRITFYFNYLL